MNLRQSFLVVVAAATAATVLGAAVPAVAAGPQRVGLSASELVFSTRRSVQSQAQTVTITNIGTGTLNVTGLSVTGTNPLFVITSAPSLPVGLTAGSTTTVAVAFAPGTAVGSRAAKLKITSNDPTRKIAYVPVYGLSQAYYGGNGEPTLSNVVKTIGNPVNVGGTQLILGTSPSPIGSEVVAPLFLKAAAGPVTITAVARYSPDERLPFGWYLPTAGPPTKTELGTIALGQYQTLNPQLEAGSTISFDPGPAAFGLYVDSITFGRSSYTQDALNTGTPHAARPYPAVDRGGVAIAGTYLVTFEDSTNGDYQDYVFRIMNVTPAP